jgi:hypothetical protein
MVDSLAEVSASRVTARHPECGSMGNSRLVAKLRQTVAAIDSGVQAKRLLYARVTRQGMLDALSCLQKEWFLAYRNLNAGD